MHCPPAPQCCVCTLRAPHSRWAGPRGQGEDPAAGSPQRPSLRLRGPSTPRRCGGRVSGSRGAQAQLAASAAPSWVGWHRALPGLRAEAPGERAGMPTARSFPGRTSRLVPTLARLRPVRAANREAERPGKDSPKVTPRAAAWGPVPRAPPGGRDPPRRAEGPSRSRGRGGGEGARLGAGRAGLPGAERPAGSAPRRPPRPAAAPPAAPAARGGSPVARGERRRRRGRRGSAPGNALVAPRGGGAGEAPQQLPLVKNTPALPCPAPAARCPSAQPRPAPPRRRPSPARSAFCEFVLARSWPRARGRGGKTPREREREIVGEAPGR